MLSDGKVKPYQFGLANISGFRDHSLVTDLRTNRNQLVNIYLMILSQNLSVGSLYVTNEKCLPFKGDNNAIIDLYPF